MVLTEKFYKEMMTLPGVRCVFNGYGMTECAALTTTIDLSGLSNGYKLMPNIPPLSCAGRNRNLFPYSMLRYWKGTKENNEQFQDGWMRTGDLGYYDSQGFVYVVDRIKETFKYFNCHISPAELEEVTLTHPSVEEAVVVEFMIQMEETEYQELLSFLKHGIESDDFEALQDDIRMFVDSKVASYKRLRVAFTLFQLYPRTKREKSQGQRLFR
ncbi:4-coumarate--CoA ligase-like 9 [Orchesella cincta]|uniref:4-coumarate--CoA ligase-like 9 n=1 Tax=Orchesella cincta TaxID=48709 RepID=A0A1D2M648_ORCCI|nr:4-coumarate--CoA ligase-like 9 [Orchesella cincta]